MAIKACKKTGKTFGAHFFFRKEWFCGGPDLFSSEEKFKH